MFERKEAKIPETKRQEILLKIKPIIAEQLDIAEDKIQPTSNITDDLGADSLDAVEIIMALEETFNIEIPDEDIDRIKTVEDVIVYLAGRV